MPRFVPKCPADVALAVVMDVTVLDLSATGILLSCDYRPGIGQRIQVRMVLNREPFVAWIDVKRVERTPAPTDGDSAFLVGAVFSSFDEQSGRALQQFTSSVRNRD